MNMAKTEAAAGSPEQSIGPIPPKLTSEQLCNIGFAVLRAHNDDRLWRALTYDSGPYDLTTPNLALQELGAAFYAAGYAEAPRTTMKVEVSSDPEMVRRTLRAEAEVALLRAALNGGNVIERLQFALQRLADATEALGVNNFGEDWRSDEVQELQAATHAARLVLGPNVRANLEPTR